MNKRTHTSCCCQNELRIETSSLPAGWTFRLSVGFCREWRRLINLYCSVASQEYSRCPVDRVDRAGDHADWDCKQRLSNTNKSTQSDWRVSTDEVRTTRAFCYRMKRSTRQAPLTILYSAPQFEAHEYSYIVRLFYHNEHWTAQNNIPKCSLTFLWFNYGKTYGKRYNLEDRVVSNEALWLIMYGLF